MAKTNLAGHCYHYWVPIVSSIVAAEFAAHSLIASPLETYLPHSLAVGSESLRIGVAAAVDPGTVVAAAAVAAFVASCCCPCQQASAQHPEEPMP